MKKFLSKSLIAGALAGALVITPMAAFAKDGGDPPPEAPQEEKREDHQEMEGSWGTTWEVIGWMLIGMTNEMLYGPEGGAAATEQTIREHYDGNGSSGGGNRGGGGAQQQR